MPVFQVQTGTRTKIEQLENHHLESAFVQGELAAERLDRLVDLKALQHEWDHLDGWQPHVVTRTVAGVKDAKRVINPGLYDRIADLEWQIKRLTEEIDRLERDATKVSRVYSMITGS